MQPCCSLARGPQPGGQHYIVASIVRRAGALNAGRNRKAERRSHRARVACELRKEPALSQRSGLFQLSRTWFAPLRSFRRRAAAKTATGPTFQNWLLRRVVDFYHRRTPGWWRPAPNGPEPEQFRCLSTDATGRVCSRAALSLVVLSPAANTTLLRRSIAGPVLPADGIVGSLVRLCHGHPGDFARI